MTEITNITTLKLSLKYKQFRRKSLNCFKDVLLFTSTIFLHSYYWPYVGGIYVRIMPADAIVDSTGVNCMRERRQYS